MPVEIVNGSKSKGEEAGREFKSFECPDLNRSTTNEDISPVESHKEQNRLLKRSTKKFTNH